MTRPAPSTAATPKPVVDADGRVRAALSAHYATVWRSLRRFGVQASGVDDAAQQVFLVFAGSVERVPLDAERAFLLATAFRVAANARRKHGRSPEIPSPELDREASRLPTPEQLLDWKERRCALDLALAELPLEQRAVFVLFELEGFSLPEIASTLAIPLGTATSRLRRARVFFEDWVRRNEPGDRP